MFINTLIRWIKPHEQIFFDLLEASADNLFLASELFERELRTEDAVHWAGLRRDMKELEHKGDEVTREILDRLSQTFVTPIEREDIRHLAHLLDDTLDALDAITERLVIYRIGAIQPALLEMSSLASEGCKELVDLVKGLRDMSNPKAAYDKVRFVKELENRADAVYHAGLAQIFHDQTDPVVVVKWKEILDTMERTLDALDHAAQAVGTIVMKNA